MLANPINARMNIIHSTVRFFSLFRRAFGDYKWHIALMAALNFLSGTLEGIGITAIIPLFSFIGGGGAATDGISRAIGEFFSYAHLPYSAKPLLLFMVVLFLAKALFVLISQQVTVRIIADFEKKKRSELLASTFAARWPFLSVQKLGHLDQMLTTEISRSSSILYYSSSAMLVIANLVIYSFLVLNISLAIAVFALLSGLLLFFVFMPLLHKTKIISDAMVHENKNLAHFANEHIIGAKAIKSMNLEGQVVEKGTVVLNVIRKLYLKSAFLTNITGTLLQLFGVLFIVGLFAFLYKTEAFHFASFAVVVYALSKVFSNIQFAQNNAHVISSQVPYLASILRYQDDALRNKESDAGSAPFRFENELSFSDVSFAYHEGEPALSHITFSVKKGEIMGLVGPSGAGKTTVVDILLRLISPTGGTVCIDGRDISAIGLKDWRRHVGYMSQDVFLLNDTIENNIRFYDSAVGDRDIVSAAKMAHIYDFVQSQPQRFQTPVGERGVSLSVGQRQRIALARVLARKPTLLILDEATSALDNESEALIQQSIQGLRGNTTVIIIAHRLSTVMISDRVITLEEGRIIEEGNPVALVKDTYSHFFKMYHANKQ